MRTLLAVLLLACPLFSREVAITIDDLPVVGSCGWERAQAITRGITGTLRREKIPVATFVVAGMCPDLTDEQRRALFKMWRSAGATFGNHTWSHPDLNTMPVAEYEANILRADAELRRILGVERLSWFRSPMLHTGVDPAAKAHLAAFLAEHGWRQAPVTFDNSDWMFALFYKQQRERVRAEYVPYLESVVEFFEKRSVEVVGREFPQIMLLHASEMNAEMLGEVIRMFRKRGYTFVSLERAMQDPAYALPDEYAGKGGFSWIHRWSITKKMPNKGEPEEPAWLQEEYNRKR